MELWERQAIFSQNVAKLINRIEGMGYFCVFGQAFRQPHTENENDKLEKVNNLHKKRLAIDLHLIDHNGIFLPDHPAYKQFGSFWETLHVSNVWGGKIRPMGGHHFQMRDS